MKVGRWEDVWLPLRGLCLWTWGSGFGLALQLLCCEINFSSKDQVPPLPCWLVERGREAVWSGSQLCHMLSSPACLTFHRPTSATLEDARATGMSHFLGKALETERQLVANLGVKG